MKKDSNGLSRRTFLKTSGLAITGTPAGRSAALGEAFKNETLQVWSCGGLAEAFIPANGRYKEISGTSIAYTGAFAAALGKSLLGSAQTEVFAPRVLELARKLKARGKMLYFKPLCFTRYVLVTPRGNPANIQRIEDLARPGVRVVLSPDASAPGGKASIIILKKAGVLEGAEKNAIVRGDCVQRVIPYLVNGKGDVAVAEARLTCLPEFRNKLDVIDIPEKFIPGPPVPFTIGVMKWAKNRDLAEDFVNFILLEQGQSFFERAGFIPAVSKTGERLIKKYGVTDA
ncbi:MAG: substrate-binding domain-containing protein [Deltaproteobacteria bacterium]|nr:substrate-binding domain-containing protein [Deltaproteobacteria bacterium]MBW2100851.1 substrate-binding domain-containing protein [Deltaproteobacteria bacterium]